MADITRIEKFLGPIRNIVQGISEGHTRPKPISREEHYLDDIATALESGGGGTSDYTDLTNKPSINGVTLTGDKSTVQLGILPFAVVGEEGWVLCVNDDATDISWKSPYPGLLPAGSGFLKSDGTNLSWGTANGYFITEAATEDPTWFGSFATLFQTVLMGALTNPNTKVSDKTVVSAVDLIDSLKQTAYVRKVVPCLEITLGSDTIKGLAVGLPSMFHVAFPYEMSGVGTFAVVGELIITPTVTWLELCATAI